MIRMVRPRRLTLLSIAILFALCAGFYWRILFTDQYTYLDSPDLANMELPRYQFLASELRHLRFPLWDPHQWCGQPFLGGFTGAAYPLNWILPPLRFAGGKVSIPLMHWLYVLIHFQGALFAFLLCRGLGRSRAASVLAGLVFSLAGFMGETDWPQVLNGAVWGPAVALFLLRAVRGRPSWPDAALSGVCLGLAWLSGHHEAPVYLSMAAGALWGWHLLKGEPPRRAVLGMAALAFALTALTSGLQTVPGAEFGRLSQRWAGWPEPLKFDQPVPYTVHESYSFTPGSLPAIVLPTGYAHVSPFVGVTAFTLALLGVLLSWKREPHVRVFAVLAVAALLFAMAANTWVHGLLYAVLPVFGKARVPARALVVFSLAMAPLAAYGLDAVLRDPGSRWLRRVSVALFAAAGCGFAAAAAFWALTNAPATSRLLISATAAILLAPLLAGWRAGAIGARALAVSGVLLCLWELGSVGAARFPNRLLQGRPSPLARLLENDDIASYLRAQPGTFRVAVNDQDIAANFGQWQGIDMLEGYMAGVTLNIFGMEPYAPHMQNLLNVEYAVARKPGRPDQQEVFAGATGIRVYRNPGALPRARIVHEAVRAPSHDHRRLLYADAAFDPRRRTAMVSETPALESCAAEGETVRVATYRPGRVEIDAKLNCRGMVILADTWFPGWRARVDRAPARIWEADGALRGVVAEKGSHRIVMTYRPASVYTGAAMTLAGLLAGGMALYGLRRGRRERGAAVAAQ